ncbi:MAG: YgeY family selenium metabolism-linked hydrolase, partial [bacterium]
VSGEEEGVVERIKDEFNKLDYDEVFTDEMGNVYGRIGDGPRAIAIDAHIDTVDVTDPDAWDYDPYGGEIEDGNIFGRGSTDQTSGMVSGIYGGQIIRDLDLLPDEISLYIVGTVQEEDCDGLCWDYILSEDVLNPEAVVVTEPTELDVKRGHRGRMEMQIDTHGVSCHGSAPERGENAIYKMGPLVNEIEDLNERLRDHDFLGKGTIVLSQIWSRGPSQCAVPDKCSAYIDRRLTVGETMESSLEEIRNLPSFDEEQHEVFVPTYRKPSWTGFEYDFLKYYPTWCLEEDHPVIRSGVGAYRDAFDSDPVVTNWTFSTNGVSIAGKHNVPVVGFGPGIEEYAHAPNERVPIKHLTGAAEFFAAWPKAFVQTNATSPKMEAEAVK